jgi:opacity protein-like surface antigen
MTTLTFPNHDHPSHGLHASLMAAAFLLPLAVAPVQAETAPEKTTLAYKYLDYLDSQVDADRISVKAHALMLTAPIKDDWSFSGTYVNDAVSGASPRYYTKRLTKMHDERQGYSAGLTHYMPTGTAAVTANYSVESDYVSKSLSATRVWFTDDSKNTTLTAGLGITRDAINPSNHAVEGERKRVNDLMFGVTQVFTPNDIGQLNLRYAAGSGYFSDPYKAFDERPRERNISTALVRWNHHFEGLDGTLRSSYRYYSDSYKVKAHTLGFEYAQAIGTWTVTPLVRLHTQSAAWFYVPYNPEPNGVTFPADTATYYTEDQRMSGFGALTLGLKVARQITPSLLVDIKYEHYKQKPQWSNGGGDLSLGNFKARSLQFGVSYQF